MQIESGLEEIGKQLAKKHAGTVFDLVGAEISELSKKRISASFTLNAASRQVFGNMHGGIYAYIAESLASLGGWLNVDLNSQICVGTEINASHLKSVSKLGEKIDVVATPIRVGKKMHWWQVNFHNSKGELVSIARCTLFVAPKID